jgi:predicted amidophosphoribosyltransferase
MAKKVSLAEMNRIIHERGFLKPEERLFTKPCCHCGNYVREREALCPTCVKEIENDQFDDELQIQD